MNRLAASLAMALASLVTVSSALAAPQTDQNAGTWTDSYQDNTGIAVGAQTFDVKHDPAGQLVTLAVGKASGQVSSIDIAPVSFDTWGKVYLDYSAANTTDLEVRFLGQSGTTYGPFALAPSDVVGWKSMVSLATVPASELTGRLLVKLVRFDRVVGLPDPQNGESDDIHISPTLLAARVTWSPRSVIRVSTEAPASACASAQFTVKTKVSVSYVNAKSVVVATPLPLAPADPLGRTYPLNFVSATNGGTLTTTATTVGGVAVAANSVYWQLGDVNAGNTFVVSFNVSSPTGTLNGTTYTTSAAAKAANSALASYPPAAVAAAATTIQSSAALTVRKTSQNTFLIGDKYYINADQTLGYNIFYANWEFPPPTCTAVSHRTIVWDDVSDLVTPTEPGWAGGSIFTGTLPSAFTIQGGGIYTANAINVDGVSVPAKSIYWNLGTLEVGQRGNLSYTLKLKKDTDHAGPLPQNHQIDNVAAVQSGLTHEAGGPSASRVYIGIPNTPSGIYAKGDRIRGSAGIGAGRDDNWWLSVGYGEPITFLLYAQNGGASTLADTLLVDRVPANTAFSSLAVPAGATAYYQTATTAVADDKPPAVDVTTGALGAGWSTTPPANLATVTWVAVKVPRLSSTYFPDANIPTSVTAELTVTVNPPGAGCGQEVINNLGLFQSYGYIKVGETAVTAITGITDWVKDGEPVLVKPVVPSFEFSSMSASPASLAATGDVTFNLSLFNQQSGGVETDTARNVSVVLTLPRTRINGLDSAVPFVSVDAAGGTVDLAGLPTTLTVRYENIPPSTSRGIAVRVNVPKGYISGASIGMSAAVRGDDDVPQCSPVVGTFSASATLAGSPYLVVSKRTNLGVASPGSQVEYALDYVNIGDTVATGSWIVDRIPPGTSIASAELPALGGEVWFSSTAPPALPANLRGDSPVLTDALVRSTFTRGSSSGGRVYPSVSGPTWVAFLVDNANLSPAQLEIGQSRTVRYNVTVDGGVALGTTLRNEAGILSRELLPAISNEVITFVSQEPSLELTRACPAVVGANEPFTYTVDYVNNSTNLDYAVVLSETLPAEVVFQSASHAFLAGAHPGVNVPVVRAGQTLTADVGAALGGPLGSREGGRMTVAAKVLTGTPSGTFVELTGLASAKDITGLLDKSAFSSCRVLVENCDLFVRLSVDQPAPVRGEVVTYTALVSNEGANDADNVSLVVTLPTNVTYVPNSVHVLTAGWSVGGDPILSGGGRVLTWNVLNGRGLTKAGDAIGHFPGHSGDVAVTFQASIGGGVPVATTLTTTAVVATTSAEDPIKPNSASVDVRTPRPDPYVIKTAPSFAQPGQTITYRLRYGNASRESTGPIVLIDKLWDAPTGDGKVDVTYLGSSTQAGETVWFHAANVGPTAPAFDPQNPAASGWSKTPGLVQWIAIQRSNLGKQEGPFSVYIDVALRTPVSGLTPLPGSTITNVASIAPAGPSQDGDDDPSNNTSTVTTKTPGVDVAMDLLCDPAGAYPGAIPGQAASVTLTLVNNGTVPAYGLKVDYPTPSGFDKLGDDAVTVAVIGASGAPAKLVDATGQPISEPVSWSKSGNTFVLGDASSTAARYYRKVGLPAGAKAVITVTGKFSANVGSGTPVTQTATAVIDYRFDFNPAVDQKEEITTNNAASCGATVYRADPMVAKSAAGFGATPPFTAGDQVTFTIAYNNVGGASASDVVIEDYFAEGIPYIVGSFKNLPDGAVLELDDGSGNFDYVTPAGTSRHVRPGRARAARALARAHAGAGRRHLRAGLAGRLRRRRVRQHAHQVAGLGGGERRQGRQRHLHLAGHPGDARRQRRQLGPHRGEVDRARRGRPVGRRARRRHRGGAHGRARARRLRRHPARRRPGPPRQHPAARPPPGRRAALRLWRRRLRAGREPAPLRAAQRTDQPVPARRSRRGLHVSELRLVRLPHGDLEGRRRRAPDGDRPAAAGRPELLRHAVVPGLQWPALRPGAAGSQRQPLPHHLSRGRRRLAPPADGAPGQRRQRQHQLLRPRRPLAVGDQRGRRRHAAHRVAADARRRLRRAVHARRSCGDLPGDDRLQGPPRRLLLRPGERLLRHSRHGLRPRFPAGLADDRAADGRRL
ncbi:MAG: DUF11 domain-containing protein [Myxococcota bacterium]